MIAPYEIPLSERILRALRRGEHDEAQLAAFFADVSPKALRSALQTLKSRGRVRCEFGTWSLGSQTVRPYRRRERQCA